MEEMVKMKREKQADETVVLVEKKKGNKYDPHTCSKAGEKARRARQAAKLREKEERKQYVG